MSKNFDNIKFGADLHLGHKNVHKFRTQFKTAEEHHQTVFENFATSINKRDVVYFLGDIAFDREWLSMIGSIRCLKKVLVLGNHDTEHLHIKYLTEHFDHVHGLFSFKNLWLSHCPVHPDEMRKKIANIHGHIHFHNIEDKRYVNVSLEQINYKPITLTSIYDILEERGL